MKPLLDTGLELRSADMARLTILIPPQLKRAFDALCASKDLTSSQVLRSLIAAYVERHGYNPRPPDFRPPPS